MRRILPVSLHLWHKGVIISHFVTLQTSYFLFPKASLIPYIHTKFTRASSKKLFVQSFAKTKYYFLSRIINKWNNLPITVQMSHSF